LARAEIEGGVIATPVPITAGGSVHIIYSGLLSESGADRVYLHTGYGPSYKWDGLGGTGGQLQCPPVPPILTYSESAHQQTVST
jgi:hypothetical protein